MGGASRDDLRFWSKFFLAALAGWRITHLLSREDGPGNVLASLRARLGNGAWGELMDCFHCTSVWVAAPLALFVARRPRNFVPTWLALSGAACGIERFSSKPVFAEPVNELEGGGPFYGMLRPETVGDARAVGVAAVEPSVR